MCRHVCSLYLSLLCPIYYIYQTNYYIYGTLIPYLSAYVYMIGDSNKITVVDSLPQNRLNSIEQTYSLQNSAKRWTESLELGLK